MVRTRSFVVFAASALAILSVACSSGDLAVGKSDQKLQTQTNGQPTGNGSTCSWQGTSQWAASGPALPPKATEVHNIGDSFKSLDDCNDCSCTAKGIMCTIRTCSTPPRDPGDGVACTEEAKECPDGSYVSRQGPNCEFAPCPSAGSVDESKLGPSCETDHYSCPSGQSCNSFSGVGFRCASDPCGAVTCPSGQQCVILESFPAQIRCAAQ